MLQTRSISGAPLDCLYFDNNAGNVQMSIGEHPTAMLALQNKVARQTQAIQEIYTGASHQVNETLFDIYLGNYHKAIAGVPNRPELTQMFQINAGRLAASKTFNLTNELTQIKKRTIGDPDEYKRIARLITNKYNRYQAAEYNTMVHRARVAKQFESFQRTKHLYPNLEWVRTRSASPRDQHLRYVGTILPMEHKFFRDNVPGSLYNCKCSLQVTDKPTTEPPEVDITPNPGLEGNPYFTETLISDQHPYFTNTPKHIPDVGVLRLPDDIAYISRTTTDGISYLEHYLVGKEQEVSENRSIAELLLANGYTDIRLLPRIHAKEALLREHYYGKGFHPTKCPDAQIGNVLVEFKEVGNRNISHAIADAAKKSSIAVIKLTKPLTDVKNMAVGKLKQHSKLERIIIITHDSQVAVFKR